jgi:hypothetical protein
MVNSTEVVGQSEVLASRQLSLSGHIFLGAGFRRGISAIHDLSVIAIYRQLPISGLLIGLY